MDAKCVNSDAFLMVKYVLLSKKNQDLQVVIAHCKRIKEKLLSTVSHE